MSQEVTHQLAIMFTDIVDYSSLMRADEHLAIQLLEDHRHILSTIIDSRGGTVIEYVGDSIFARFHDPVEAVEAALEIQRILPRYNREHGRNLRCRIGIHYGEVVEQDGHLFGDNINIGARLEPLSDPEGVCISDTVRRKLNTALQKKCVSFGRPLLKNIGDKLEVFHLFPSQIDGGKRLTLQLRHVKRYLGDHSQISGTLAFVLLFSAAYLLIPLFFRPTIAAHYVGLGEIRNLSPEQLPEYYTIGVADEINSRLKDVANLYLSGPEDEIATEVNITSSIEQLGDKVRIAYQITRQEDGSQIAEGSIEGKLEKMLTLQSKLADKVAVALASEFSLPFKQKKIVKHEVKPEAYQYYLQARDYANRPIDKQTLNTSISLYRKALDSDNRFAAAYAGLCDAFWRMYQIVKDFHFVGQAEQACLQAESLDADLSEVQVELGNIYMRRGRMAESIVAYNKAIKLQPRNIEAFIGLARVYLSINKPKLAEQTYRRAIALQHGNWKTWNAYGYYQIKTGQYEGAEASFRRVVELTPDNVNAYSNLGATLLYLGDFKRAAQAFSKQAELKPSADIFSNLATMYYYDGDFARAAHVYAKATEMEPRHCNYWTNLGDALRQLPDEGDKADDTDTHALTLCSKELEVNPANQGILSIKSRLLARLGWIDEALELILTYKLNESRNPDIQLDLALTYLYSGRMENVKNSLERAVEQGYPQILIKAEPEFIQLQTEPWFQSLVGGTR